ncbi:hypothetical protein EJ05DRAFT_495943 [Pseudovirgaria hyperparasitica]|uniref:Ecp2 effector protein domain-containing protein n=1 Tax=Pseudovirgaria hyperparasitica TaxID=470096 RepID=A0A6A6WLL5_9PEZI|nr:uncharacterized protein EJ05DRAFT_495943 [Pseudovirgaria hyperparasitica]KAF2763104.1 hypothetical protein EJ05DRAFT_495943 [Pseudovirgaria hyperparasitica]
MRLPNILLTILATTSAVVAVHVCKETDSCRNKNSFRKGIEGYYDLDNVTVALHSGYITCFTHETALNRTDLEAAKASQMKTCDGHNTYSGAWQMSISGKARTYVCNVGSEQTCHPEDLKVMHKKLDEHCKDFPGVFSIKKWRVRYGRNNLGKLQCPGKATEFDDIPGNI